MKEIKGKEADCREQNNISKERGEEEERCRTYCTAHINACATRHVTYTLCGGDVNVAADEGQAVIHADLEINHPETHTRGQPTFSLDHPPPNPCKIYLITLMIRLS